MRVTSEQQVLDVRPGAAGTVIVAVTNTGEVIDGVTARVVGFPDRHLQRHPEVLALFPEQTGSQSLTLTLPTNFPAGRHPLTVELHSRQPAQPTAYLDLELVVPEMPEVTVHAVPEVIRARRTGRFVVTVTNRGNLPLDVELSAADNNRQLSLTTEPARLALAAGAALDALLTVRAPRVLLGADQERPIVVTATARADHESMPVAVATEVIAPSGLSTIAVVEEATPGTAEPIEATFRLVLKHRALFTRGSLTALILLLVIGIWAAIFLLGIGQVFAADPLTKRAPPLFFVAAQGQQTAPSAAAAGSGADGTVAGGGSGSAQAAVVVPAGAVPKDGVVPPGVGGTVAGLVTAASDGQPVGRILVEAQRVSVGGARQTAGSAATQADGSYQISGLFPGQYVLQFSANGYETLYTQSAVTVRAAQVAVGADVVVIGNNATISGTIDPGDTLDPVDAQVELRPLTGPQAGQVLATVTADPAGAYSFADVPAPGSYRLSFVSPGYTPTEVRTSVAGGANRIQSAVLLGAGEGTIAGTVTNGGAPLGGATIVTTVDGTALTTGTPTSGTVGRFVLSELPTPATYVLTIAADGFGTTTVVVDLGPGELVEDLQVPMTSGSGTVIGRAEGSDGAGLGGVTVTVGGTANAPTTTTLTEGDVGAFRFDGLPSPGTYTLTFTLAGYLETTVPVVLGDEATPPVEATLARAVGAIAGQVTDSSGVPLVGLTVTATNGLQPRPVTTTAASGGVPRGGYVIDALPAGRYTVTVTGTTGISRTQLVTVTAGVTSQVSFAIPGAG